MSNLKYDPETYKNKLIKYLKKSTSFKSKNRHREETFPAPTTPEQSTKVKRKVTPYHPSIKPSLAVYGSDSDYGSTPNQGHKVKSQKRKSAKFSEEPMYDRKGIKRKATPFRSSTKSQRGGNLQKALFNNNFSYSSEESEEITLLPSKCEYEASPGHVSRNLNETNEEEEEEEETYIFSSEFLPSQRNFKRDNLKTKNMKKPKPKNGVKSKCETKKTKKTKPRIRSKMKIQHISCNSRRLKLQPILPSSSDSETDNFVCKPLSGSIDYTALIEKKKSLQNIQEPLKSNDILENLESVSENSEPSIFEKTNETNVPIIENKSATENLDDRDKNLEDIHESVTEAADTPSCKTVLFPLEQGLLIIMHEGSKLYFHGLMSVKVLTGSVEILGSTVTPSLSPIEVFSPRGTSFLYFEAKTGENLQLSKFTGLLTTLKVDNEKIGELFTQEKIALIFCEDLVKPEIAFIEKHIPQQIFPTSGKYLPRCDFQSQADSALVMKVNPEWDKHLSNVDAETKLFVCGGKSVGKSTMIRYAINKLLERFQEILLVDLDPGQPEFTVPGCISATIVKEPVFGPNYTHLRKTFRCFFVPNINIGHDSQDYIQKVKHLISSLDDAPKVPTFINYMGYIRGLGFETLSAVTALVKPTYMVEIRSKNRTRNFERKLTYENISEAAKFLIQLDDIPQFPIHTVKAMTDDLQGWQLEPRQIREMIILAYLSKLLPENILSLTHTAVPVYVNNISSLQLIYEDKSVSPAAVNANLVALCSSSSHNCYVCHGWGVVRAISTSTDEIFFLTPLLLEELELVDRFVLGSVTLPPSLYMTVDDQVGLVPYVCTGVLDTFGQIPKRSHLPVNFK